MTKKSLEKKLNYPGSAYDLTSRLGRPGPCIKPKGNIYDLTYVAKLRRYHECLKRRYGRK